MRSSSGRSALIAIVIFLGGLAGAGPAHAADPDFAFSPPLSQGPDQALVNGMLAAAGHSAWIGEGRGTHIVYVFFDPNCPYCHKLFAATRSMIDQGRLQLRWIPVGILTPTSMGKAAAMLQARDPQAAFYVNERGYDRTRKHGGLSPLPHPATATVARLNANADVLARSNSMVVPTLLFRGKGGEAVLVEGAPSSGLQRLLGNAR